MSGRTKKRGSRTANENPDIPARVSVPVTLAALGSRLVRWISGLLAAVLILYSGYVLWDTIYTGQSAFSSWDLLQYKPGNVGEEPGFNELRDINPEVCAWLTLDDTNIDYPVVQGGDDLDYINKDVYGQASLTGAIFLTTLNRPDFSDSYNLIYGHHMENGAMFGDIDRFADQAFLDAHRSGNLITPDAVYDLNVFACVSTDAYESMIYGVQEKTEESYAEILAYSHEHAFAWEDVRAENLTRLLVLSTCAEANTNGRTVLLADMTLRTEPLPPRETPQRIVPPVSGHGSSRKWAFLNLVCVALCFLHIGQWEQLGIRRDYLFLVGKERKRDPEGVPGERTFRKKTSEVKASEKNVSGAKARTRNQRRLSTRARAGILLEILLAVCALILFLMTEDIRTQLTVIDAYTPFMIGIYALAVVVEHTVLRVRRGAALAEESEEPKSTH